MKAEDMERTEAVEMEDRELSEPELENVAGGVGGGDFSGLFTAASTQMVGRVNGGCPIVWR